MEQGSRFQQYGLNPRISVEAESSTRIWKSLFNQLSARSLHLGEVMSNGADISTLYREFTQALTDVLAEHAVGPASRGRLARARAVVKKHPLFNRLATEGAVGYLEAVFAIVEHYKVRRKTKTLLRHAFKFAELPFDRNADPFTAVIRCTCADLADSKAISKWARALRYVARCKVSPTQLKTFMKEAGGVNACADRYAKYLGRIR